MDDSSTIPQPVAIAYDADALSGDAASRDVLDQIEAVEQALAKLGLRSLRVGADLDAPAFKKRLLAANPGVVFNLVESLDGSDRLQALATMLLEEWRLPFTGCGSLAMLLSNHKIAAKQRLVRDGLPTPDCLWLNGSGRPAVLFGRTLSGSPGERGGDSDDIPPADWIVKAVEAHASVHMDDGSVLRRAGPREVAARLRETTDRHGQAFFAERFVEGREFNLSLLANGDDVDVLPASEICFDELPPGRPRIVGYAAKWDGDSPEYLHTARLPAGSEQDRPLVAELSALARAAWRSLGLAGYARVDFRVDESGRPFILEANSNPCLSPDAGFAITAREAGMEYDELTRRIVVAALNR